MNSLTCMLLRVILVIYVISTEKLTPCSMDGVESLVAVNIGDLGNHNCRSLPT